MEVERDGKLTRISMRNFEVDVEFESLPGTVRITFDFGKFRVSAEVPADEADHLADELGDAAFRASVAASGKFE
jgi:hypothetical protein